MAVQGEIPRRIAPAIKSGWPESIMLAKRVMRGGAITQLAIMVINNGRGFLVAFTTSLNFISITVGYIMKKRQIPMGIDILLNFKESKNLPKPGYNLPSKSPMTMQMAIHKVRYFSNSPSETSFCSVKFSPP
jgi:hypothetical protein